MYLLFLFFSLYNDVFVYYLFHHIVFTVIFPVNVLTRIHMSSWKMLTIVTHISKSPHKICRTVKLPQRPIYNLRSFLRSSSKPHGRVSFAEIFPGSNDCWQFCVRYVFMMNNYTVSIRLKCLAEVAPLNKRVIEVIKVIESKQNLYISRAGPMPSNITYKPSRLIDGHNSRLSVSAAELWIS